VSPTYLECAAIATNGTSANNVTLTVSDNAGNTSTCVSTVVVSDNTLPIFGCPATFTVAAGAGCTASVPGLVFSPSSTSSVGASEFFDNALDCGLTFDYQVNGGFIVAYPSTITTQSVNLSGLIFNAGLSTVNLRGRDASGNVGACSFSVNVADQTPPTFVNCPANITMNANTGGCGKSVTWTPPTFSDNCTIPLTPVSTYVFSTHTPGTFFYFGATTVTYTANDGSGNINNSCTFSVTINDTQAPLAHCKNATVALNGSGSVTMPASAIDDNSTDNCFYTYLTDPFSFNCSHVGIPQTISLIVVDAGLLRDTCTATVTVLDGLSPVALCNMIPATLNLSSVNPGQATLTAATVGNATDNCLASVGYLLSVDGSPFAASYTFNCANTGTHTVRLLATDGAGNSNSCAVTISVNDNLAPVITCPSPQTRGTDGNLMSCGYSYVGTNATATDNCGPISITNNFNSSNNLSGALIPAGMNGASLTTNGVWTASAPGGSSNCTQAITVVDDDKPVFTACPSNMTVNATNCSYTGTIAMNATATD
ncbi:MAG: HYR domain-containing protein, partial [Rhodoferax sp.]|nr:HYR domain-containing protein [Rhodoferax sp.]